MSLWAQVIGFADGEYIEESTLNRPIIQLRERTDFLYNRVQETLGTTNFEALRLVNVPLTIGTVAEPSVKDIVYLDPATRTYSKAVARATIESNVFQMADDAAYAVGILVSKAGDSGTVLVSGKLTLADTGDWDLATMLEDDETFRSGPYYLSARTPGKLTANPTGMSIYIGYFTDSADIAGFGGVAIISPQYKDVGEAHVHRAFPLIGQPAGTQSIIGTPPNAQHTLAGYDPRSVAQPVHGEHSGVDDATTLLDGLYNFTLANYIGLPITNVTAGTSSVVSDNDTDEVTTDDSIEWDTGDEWYIGPRTRLVVLGPYNSTLSTSYTLSLTNSTGVAAAGAAAPSNGTYGFEDAYLKWVSSDATEGSGVVRLGGYEVPVAFGTKGCRAVLENTLEGSGVTDEMWNWCEAAMEDLSRRQWIVTVPEDTRGWRARKFRQYAVNHQATDGGFSLVTFGAYTNTEGRLEEQITVVATKLYKLEYTTNPSDGDTITIDGVVYEFDDDNVLASPNNVQVTIDYTSADDTYAALRDAMLGYGADNVHIAIDADTDAVFIGVATTATAALSVGYTGAALTLAYSGATADISAGTLVMLVYDSANVTQVPVVGYWSTIDYFKPVTLKNGLKLMFTPFDVDRNDVTSSDVVAGDYWTASIVDEAPGAVFEYALDMDSAVRQYYPPVPLSAAALVVNGIEMESYATHPDNPVWRPAYGGLYWYDDTYARVPWSVGWETVDVPGSYNTLITLYMVHMRVEDTSAVTSLQPAAGSPIKVMRCGTATAATVGDLELDLDLNLADENAGLDGYLVYKRIQGSKFLKGPVVSCIRAGAGISISSPPGVPIGVGVVTVGLSSAQDYAGDFQKLALRNAKQELIGMFPYTRLLGWNTYGINRPSGLVAQFQVPYTIEGEYQVYVYMTVFGEEDIAFVVGGLNTVKYVGMTMDYSVLRDYLPSDAANLYGTLTDNVITPANGPVQIDIPLGVAPDGVTYTDANGATSTKVYGAFDPMVVHNNPNETDTAGRIIRVMNTAFPVIGDLKGTVATTAPLSNVTVRAGSMIGIELQRANASNPSREYTGALGIMQLRWRLTRVD
jgi:hypothetical protein